MERLACTDTRMELLFFTGLNSEGHYQACSFGGTDLTACFEALNTLVSRGWQLISVKAKSVPGGEIELPIEAFDGQSISPTLRQLQQEWQAVLQLQ